MTVIAWPGRPPYGPNAAAPSETPLGPQTPIPAHPSRRTGLATGDWAATRSRAMSEACPWKGNDRRDDGNGDETRRWPMLYPPGNSNMERLRLLRMVAEDETRRRRPVQPLLDGRQDAASASTTLPRRGSGGDDRIHRRLDRDALARPGVIVGAAFMDFADHASFGSPARCIADYGHGWDLRLCRYDASLCDRPSARQGVSIAGREW